MDQLPHILFVDDEENILQGLKRGMRRHRKKWDMSFANCGADALEIVANKPVDIIISDMRMPQMDGAELLENVRNISPDTARVVLSGYAKDEVVLRVIGPAHQYLAKPTDFQVIENTIERLLRLRHCIGNAEVRKIITGTTNLPSLPQIYNDLVQELESPISNNKTIAAVLEKDLGLKAQVLKVCNSAFFGLPQKVNCLENAVSLLGVNTLRSMTLLNGVFSTLKQNGATSKILERLTSNCIDIAMVASKLGKIAKFDNDTRDLVVSAGSLSHIGTLLIAATWPEKFMQAGQRCETGGGQSIDTYERELIGSDHGLIGAYLLGLWGFPLSLCEAVAFHHRPDEIGEGDYPVLACLHLAQYLTKMHSKGKLDMESISGGVDLEFLKRQNLLLSDEVIEEILEEMAKKEG